MLIQSHFIAPECSPLSIILQYPIHVVLPHRFKSWLRRSNVFHHSDLVIRSILLARNPNDWAKKCWKGKNDNFNDQTKSMFFRNKELSGAPPLLSYLPVFAISLPNIPAALPLPPARLHTHLSETCAALLVHEALSRCHMIGLHAEAMVLACKGSNGSWSHKSSGGDTGCTRFSVA